MTDLSNDGLMQYAHVTWLDSAGNVGWSDEVPEVERIESLGFIVRESKDSITLSTSQSPQGIWHAALTIPKFAIKGMRKGHMATEPRQ